VYSLQPFTEIGNTLVLPHACKRLPLLHMCACRLSSYSLSLRVSLIVRRWGAGERLLLLRKSPLIA